MTGCTLNKNRLTDAQTPRPTTTTTAATPMLFNHQVFSLSFPVNDSCVQMHRVWILFKVPIFLALTSKNLDPSCFVEPALSLHLTSCQACLQNKTALGLFHSLSFFFALVRIQARLRSGFHWIHLA